MGPVLLCLAGTGMRVADKLETSNNRAVLT
jgi:hypothetical protein